MAAIKSFGERIADALVEDGLLQTKQVEELLEQQKKEGTRLLKIIVDKGLVTESDMAVSMGRVLNVPPVNLARCGIAPEIGELLPRDICQNSSYSLRTGSRRHSSLCAPRFSGWK